MGVGVSSVHKSTILAHPKPLVVKQMLSFLGLANYSRHHVADYADKTGPLRDMVNLKGMKNLNEPLDWKEDAEHSFIQLKQDLSMAADMSLPDYSKPFHLDVSAKARSVSAVLYQKKGVGDRLPIMYVSTSLDTYEKRHAPCEAITSATARLLTKVEHVVLHHPLIVHTSHSMVQLVGSSAFTMTAARQTKTHSILTQPNITWSHEGINMADHIIEFEPHDCVTRTRTANTVRTDLQAERFAHPDVSLFTDGYCFKSETGLSSAYAVVQATDTGFCTVEARAIAGKQSAQRAEIIGLTAALKYAAGKVVNVYTDSAYVCTVVHCTLAEWNRNAYITAGGQEVKHLDDVKELEQALQLPSQVAIIKCKAHTNQTDFVSQGNQAADEAAKAAAGYCPNQLGSDNKLQMTMLCSTEELRTIDPKAWQEAASPEERSMWKARGAVKTESGVWEKDGKPAIPAADLKRLILEAHGPTHVGKQEIKRKLVKFWWHPYLNSMCDDIMSECEVCMMFNVKPTTQPTPVHRTHTFTAPGQEITIDFTDMITPCNGYRFLLVVVDRFTGWPEA